MENELNRNATETTPSDGSGGTGTAARMKKQVVDTASEMKSKVTELGRTAMDRLDENRERLANTVEHAASAVHERTDAAAGAMHATADRLQSTADYIREKDARALADDARNLVTNFIRRYPVPALAAGIFCGFAMAILFRSGD